MHKEQHKKLWFNEQRAIHETLFDQSEGTKLRGQLGLACFMCIRSDSRCVSTNCFLESNAFSPPQ